MQPGLEVCVPCSPGSHLEHRLRWVNSRSRCITTRDAVQLERVDGCAASIAQAPRVFTSVSASSYP